jgi:hypothetical protein
MAIREYNDSGELDVEIKFLLFVFVSLFGSWLTLLFIVAAYNSERRKDRIKIRKYTNNRL